jgi:hypothetical protein
MVAFFAATFLAVWRAQELGSAGRSVAALAYAGLAALAAVSGSMTKLVFLGPLPFFAGVQLLTSRAGGPWRTRIAGSFVFAAVALAAHLVYSQIVDWQAFFQQWNAVAARPGVQRAWTLRDFLPGWSAGRIFLLAEVDFWLLGALGWLGFLLRARGRRGRALWLSAFVAYALLVFAYRVSLERSFLPFNYAFVAQAVAAVFFGWATTELWRRLRLPASGWRGAAAAFAWLLLLHGIGAWAVVDARRHDARVFDANRSALELAARLGPSERIGIELEPGAESATANLTALHGITFPYVTPRRSRLSDAFAALFGPAPAGAEAGDEGRIPSPALGATLVIVRSAPADPR